MQDVQDILDEAVHLKNVTGISMSMRSDTEHILLQSGYSSARTKRPFSLNDRFQVGSLTKMFVAASILKLKDEGRLDLDQKVLDFVHHPNLHPNLTIRHLLKHRSGLKDYISMKHEGKALVSYGIQDYYLPPALLIKTAAERSPNQEPGAPFNYSNTNFIILGMIIEEITRQSASDVLDALFTHPLELKNTSLPKQAMRLSTHGHSSLTDDLTEETRERKELSFYNPSIPWTAGAMVSTPDEINKWLFSLMSGELLEDESLKEMMSFSYTGEGTEKYGLGLAQFQFYDETNAVGHRGGIQGYESLALYFPNEHACLTILINQMPGSVGLIAKNIYKTLFLKNEAQS
ncbi:beta-lactamase family protein [Halobacillus kuroshimensis]|uniref:Beta-lactamase family protein n=1 Tax=Halobacillus kuroshimensis TaxID=302481 RepID=A0ABS3DRC6_9BACI|nr:MULTISPECIES: serine hydrolase domain-containing protein [Halobacillus]MBN8233892.1 beta-lactamase family protein [Halobacillus kuroshimensis]